VQVAHSLAVSADFFTTSLSQIRLILESCLICVASVVGNTLKSSKIHDPPSFPTFSHHFPTSSLCQWHNFSERLSLLRLPLGQAQSLWDPLSKHWYIYGPFIDDLHIEK
jgi:hypothetical protein